jgi:hypothetical protein
LFDLFGGHLVFHDVLIFGKNGRHDLKT